MNLGDAIARHIGNFNHRKGRVCGKVKYRTRAAAKKALRDHGYAIGAKQWYECPTCGEGIFHLTKLNKREFEKRQKDNAL